MLAGVILGAYRGALAAALYVILGLIGLPILSGHASGLAVLAGPTAGFLIGFIPGALVAGLIAHSAKAKFSVVRVILGSLVGGIAVVYAFGIPVLAGSFNGDLIATAIFMTTYLIGDAIKVALTAIIALALYRAYPKAFKN
jgi:biotin transport system substrate-specific component